MRFDSEKVSATKGGNEEHEEHDVIVIVIVIVSFHSIHHLLQDRLKFELIISPSKRCSLLTLTRLFVSLSSQHYASVALLNYLKSMGGRIVSSGRSATNICKIRFIFLRGAVEVEENSFLSGSNGGSLKLHVVLVRKPKSERRLLEY